MKCTTKLLSLMLVLLLCIGILPTTAFATDGELVDVWVGGVQMKVGYYLPSGNNPTASSLTKTRPAGGYAYLKGVTSYSTYDAANLVLHDYSYNGKGYTKGDITSAIYNTMGLEIFIEGNNSLSGAKHGIYGTGDHCVIVISANSTADSLTIRADVDGIHTEKAFTMNNGTLDVSAGNNGIYGNYNMSFQNAKVTAAGNTGIASGQNIIFYSGTVVAEGNPNMKSSHGLWALNAVSMEGGTVTASGTRFGIECGNVEYSAGGEIYFTGGTLTAYNSYEEKPIGDYIGKNAIGVRQVFYSREGRSYENSKVIVGEDASSAVPAVGQPYKDRYVKIYPAGDDDVGKDHLIPQNLRWNGKDAQWDAVPGATKYFVNLYCEGKQWQTKVVTDTKCELPNAYYFDRCYQFTVAAFADGSYHKVSAMSPKITYDNKTVKPWGVISSVAVSNTQEPVVGDKVSWTAPSLPAGANYELNQYGGETDYAWVEHTTRIDDYDDLLKISAWHRLDDRDDFTFREGRLYTLVIGLNAKEGYEFASIDKLTGKINGTAANLSDFKLAEDGSGTLVLYRTYGEGSPDYITSVEVSNAQVPAVGDKIVWSVPTVPKNAGYEVEILEVGIYAGLPDYAWAEHDSIITNYEDLFVAAEWYYPGCGKEATFRADKYYTQVFWLDAKQGFAFAPLAEMTGTINGTPARLSDYSIVEYGAETMTLFRCFDKGCTELQRPVPANLRWDGMVAKWDAVAGASQYYVLLYRDGIPEHSITVNTNQHNWGTEIKALGTGAYRFAVAAIVNGTQRETSIQSPELNYQGSTITDPCEGYTDIDRNAWYHPFVAYVIENGYMGSAQTDKLAFEPGSKVSRAMVAQIMYKIAGNGETVHYAGTFSDVKQGAWYTNAVEWCAKNGLAAGSDGKFSPNGNVTRQELTVFMRSLARYMRKDVSGRADLSGFPDADKVPGWARDAMQWAVDYGIISGQASGGKNYLNPTAGALRSEFAAILKSFLTK